MRKILIVILLLSVSLLSGCASVQEKAMDCLEDAPDTTISRISGFCQAEICGIENLNSECAREVDIVVSRSFT